MAQAVKSFFAKLVTEQQPDDTIIVRLQEDTEINEVLQHLNRAAIPSDYVLISQDSYAGEGHLYYQNPQGEELIIGVYTADITVLLDHEKVSTSMEIEINGKQGILTQKNGVTTVLWHKGQQYMLKLTTVLPVEQAINVAQNLTAVN